MDCDRNQIGFAHYRRKWASGSNGAELGWPIDSDIQTVEVYRPGLEVETRAGAASIVGEVPTDCLVLDLAPVWDPLQDS